MNWRFDFDGEAFTMAVSGDTVYVGGHFEVTSDFGSGELVALRRDGTVVVERPVFEWDGYGDATVQAMAILGNRLYCGGTFSTVDRLRRMDLAAFDLGLSLDGWDPDLAIHYFKLAIDVSKILHDEHWTGIWFLHLGDILDERESRAEAYTEALHCFLNAYGPDDARVRELKERMKEITMTRMEP